MSKYFHLALLIIKASCEFENFDLPNYSTAMSRAVIDYILNSSFNISSTINMYHISQPENLIQNLYVMNEILYHVKTKIVVQIDNSTDFKASARKRISNIFFVDSLESFQVIYDNIDHAFFDYQGYYLIAVTIQTDDIHLKMLQAFGPLWIKKIINVNILFMPPGSINEVFLYTYYPYSSFYCEDVVPVQINQYIGHQWMRDIVYFPRKLTNFYGCHLHVATFNNPPFMIISNDENGVVTVDGVEGILLRVLAQRFHFNVDLYVQKDMFGSIFSNGTTTGATKMLVDSEVNFTLGFFASVPIRDAVMQASFAYYTTNLLWIVPPGKPQSALEKLANPLHIKVWIISSVSFLIGLVVIAVIKMQSLIIQKFVFGNDTQSPGMNFINVVLGNSLYKVPMRNFARFLLLLALIYFFIIRTCYTSGLVKFMQMDTRRQHMRNTAEMVEGNFTFYMKKATQFHVLDMPDVLQRSKVLPIPEYNAKLNDMLDDPYFDAAFLTPTGHLAYRNRMLYPKKFHEFAPEPLYTLNIVLYMSLGSCLRVYFNEMLVKLVSSGFIDKWASEFIDEKYLRKPVKDELRSLSLEQLLGAFQLLVGGLLIGFIVFCIETIIGKSLVQKGMRKIINQQRNWFSISRRLKTFKEMP